MLAGTPVCRERKPILQAGRVRRRQYNHRPGRLSPPRGIERRSCRIYLVDPASSHMLVSKTKPCMSKYKPLNGETANGSLNQLWFLRSHYPYLDNCSNSRANTCTEAPTPSPGKERFY